ncbi:MAG: sigma-54 dependent transcriptional regulator [Planctomycetota bacterium]
MLVRVLSVAARDLRDRLSALLPGSDIHLEGAAPRGGFDRALREDWDLLLFDRGALGKPAVRRLATLRERADPADVILLVDVEDPHDRAALLAAGALAVVNTEVSDEAMAQTLRALVARSRDAAVHRLRAERGDRRGSLADFVSESPAMQRFIAIAHRMVDADTSLLILGETGVGKERLARALHDEGPRRDGPFIAVNCGALTETLLESELFGHQEGAFTGAVRNRRGYFELAHGGTLFLDEVGEMPPTLQVKVLRALQERRFTPVGGEREIAVDVRVIAATNRDLQGEMRAGRFRADLYYRLSVVTLSIPPLRERTSDVPTLVRNHLESATRRAGRHPLRIGAPALAALSGYAWPGNVRELINVLERAALLAEGEEIGLADLPDAIAGSTETRAVVPPSRTGTEPMVSLGATVARAVAGIERDYLTEVLRRTRGRIGETARIAGLSERALYTKMRRHGLDKLAFRDVEAN